VAKAARIPTNKSATMTVLSRVEFGTIHFPVEAANPHGRVNGDVANTGGTRCPFHRAPAKKPRLEGNEHAAGTEKGFEQTPHYHDISEDASDEEIKEWVLTRYRKEIMAAMRIVRKENGSKQDMSTFLNTALYVADSASPAPLDEPSTAVSQAGESIETVQPVPRAAPLDFRTSLTRRKVIEMRKRIPLEIPKDGEATIDMDTTTACSVSSTLHDELTGAEDRRLALLDTISRVQRRYLLQENVRSDFFSWSLFWPHLLIHFLVALAK
jgi:hypothetical protein